MKRTSSEHSNRTSWSTIFWSRSRSLKTRIWSTSLLTCCRWCCRWERNLAAISSWRKISSLVRWNWSITSLGSIVYKNTSAIKSTKKRFASWKGFGKLKKPVTCLAEWDSWRFREGAIHRASLPWLQDLRVACTVYVCVFQHQKPARCQLINQNDCLWWQSSQDTVFKFVFLVSIFFCCCFSFYAFITQKAWAAV